MELFNIGPLELIFILLIMLIFMGPEDMLKTGKSIAKGLKKFINSPIWKSMVDTTQEIRQLPRKFIHDAGLEDSIEELAKVKKMKPLSGLAVNTSGSVKKEQKPAAENKLVPPQKTESVEHTEDTEQAETVEMTAKPEQAEVAAQAEKPQQTEEPVQTETAKQTEEPEDGIEGKDTGTE